MISPLNILFLCTGNSARSILGEALATTMSHGRLRGYSAGSHPGGKVNPFAAELCAQMDYPAQNLRSKSWDEFAARTTPGAPVMDLIVTVCDSAAGEACPVWLGHPATAHWGLPDPAAVGGKHEHQRAAFRAIHDAMKQRLAMLLALPLESMSRDALRAEMRRIGETAVMDAATEPWFPAR
jgi:arsenate reductase (thioredoxin)